MAKQICLRQTKDKVIYNNWVITSNIIKAMKYGSGEEASSVRTHESTYSREGTDQQRRA